MNWNDYRKRYSVFLSSLQQTEMIMFHAAKAIPDTPTKVQEEEKGQIPFAVNTFRRSLSTYAGGWKTDHMLLDIKPVAQMIFDGKKERILAYHELTMIIAHIEAFVGDTLIAIWLKNPSLLDTTGYGKKALREKGASSFSSLTNSEIEEATEKAVFELTKGSSDTYLYYFQNGLNLPISTKNSRILYRASLDRNAIVHNGGLMSQEKYINKLNPKEKMEVAAGDTIKISAQYIVQVYNYVQSLGEGIFEEVSKKYFGVSQPLKDEERVVNRQNHDLKPNPFEEEARQAIIAAGGPDQAVADMEHAKAELGRILRTKQNNGGRT